MQDWGLERLGRLQRLTLFLPVSAFIDSERKLALAALKRMNRLKALDITLVDIQGDYCEGISSELTFDPKMFLPNLKRFRWSTNCSSPHETKELELCIVNMASRLSSLEDFGLELKQDSELNDQKIQRATQCLTSLETDLAHLSLMFSDGELTSNSATALIEALSGPKLRNMQMLSLEFIRSWRINNGFLIELGKTLKRNMNGLRSLRLRFCSSITFSSPFKEGLLAFVGVEGITNRAIRSFGENLLEGCPNLGFLSLEFRGYSQISDKGVNSLWGNLRKIESLKKVSVMFEGRYRVALSYER